MATLESREGIDHLFVRFDPLSGEVLGCHIKRITLHIIDGVIRWTEEADVQATDVETVASVVGGEAASVLVRCAQLETECEALRAALAEADARVETKQEEVQASSDAATQASEQLARIQREILENFSPAASNIQSIVDLGQILPEENSETQQTEDSPKESDSSE